MWSGPRRSPEPSRPAHPGRPRPVGDGDEPLPDRVARPRAPRRPAQVSTAIPPPSAPPPSGPVPDRMGAGGDRPRARLRIGRCLTRRACPRLATTTRPGPSPPPGNAKRPKERADGNRRDQPGAKRRGQGGRPRAGPLLLLQPGGHALGEALANRPEGPAAFLLGSEPEEVAEHSHTAAKALAGRIGDLDGAVTADPAQLDQLCALAVLGPPSSRQKHRNAACVKSGGCSAVSSCSA